jgi:hypothetical protein
MRSRMLMVTLCAAATATAWGAAPAHACSPGMPPKTGAIPRPGTTNVSTATSLTITSAGMPSGLTLTAGGQDVPLSAPVSLGNGAGGVSFWQVGVLTPDSMLIGGAEHVLSQTANGGNAVEITRFVIRRCAPQCRQMTSMSPAVVSAAIVVASRNTEKRASTPSGKRAPLAISTKSGPATIQVPSGES